MVLSLTGKSMRDFMVLSAVFVMLPAERLQTDSS